jgi:hypothetical protein
MTQEFPNLTDQSVTLITEYKSAFFKGNTTHYEAVRVQLAAFLRAALKEAEAEGSKSTNIYQNLVKIADNLHNPPIPVPTPEEALAALLGLKKALILSKESINKFNIIRSALEAVNPHEDTPY